MLFLCFFFFNDTATTEIYTLSLHDALPICARPSALMRVLIAFLFLFCGIAEAQTYPAKPIHVIVPLVPGGNQRSEEHTSELQSRPHLVCRLLLEKKYVTSVPARSSSPQLSI